MSEESLQSDPQQFSYYQESLQLAKRAKEADLALEINSFTQRGLTSGEVQELFVGAANEVISAGDFNTASELLNVFPKHSWLTKSYETATKIASLQGAAESVLSLVKECESKFDIATPFLRTLRSEALVRLGREKEMEQEWTSLIRMSPQNIKAAALTALRLWEGGFHAECEKIWEQLWAAHPSERTTHICFARLLEKQKKYNELIQCWHRILKIFTDADAKNQCFFTAVRLTEDAVDQSIIAQLEKLTEKKVQPHHTSRRGSECFKGKGTVSLEKGRRTRAARALLREERYEDVVSQLKEMISGQEAEPGILNLCMSAALRLLERGAVGEAIRLWEELFARSDTERSGIVRGCSTFIRHLIEQNYKAQTILVFEMFKKKYPLQAQDLFRQSAKLQEAISPTRGNGSMSADRADDKAAKPSRLAISIHLLCLGRANEAIQIWENFDVTEAKDCANFAELLEQEGKSAQAEKLWKSIYAVAPSLRLAYTCDVLRRTGKFQDALPHLQASLPTQQQEQLSSLNLEALEVYAYCAGLSPSHARHPFEQLLIACERANLLTAEQAELLRKKAHRILEESRGDEIEKSLRGYGAYARSNAFRVLIEQKPHLQYIQFADTQTRRVMTNSPAPRHTYIHSPRRKQK